MYSKRCTKAVVENEIRSIIVTNYNYMLLLLHTCCCSSSSEVAVDVVRRHRSFCRSLIENVMEFASFRRNDTDTFQGHADRRIPDVVICARDAVGRLQFSR